ncbi:hypothetical protein OEZ86_005680 [Tetradesmus obliquus]|nr:hypothetical protein OEZ86_005680 [Tetradesmus obliquus]
MDGEDIISESKSYQAAGGSEDGAVPSPSQSAAPSAKQQDSGGGADGDASSNAKAKGRGNFRKDQCQVEGCSTDLLQEGKAYCVKRRLCNAHMRADQVTCRDREGLWRFCFQCGKLEPLSRFEGNKRSCKLRLAQRKQRETRRCSSDLAYNGCHVSAPLPAVSLGAADAASGQLSTVGGSTASALAGGIEHLLELIDEGDEDEEEHHDQALPFTDTDLRSMLEAQLQQLQQQCASLKEEINRTKQRGSQDPASVSCC